MILIVIQLLLDKLYPILSKSDKFIWSILLSITIYIIFTSFSYLCYLLYFIGFTDIAYSLFYYQTLLKSSEKKQTIQSTKQKKIIINHANFYLHNFKYMNSIQEPFSKLPSIPKYLLRNPSFNQCMEDTINSLY